MQKSCHCMPPPEDAYQTSALLLDLKIWATPGNKP